MQQNRDYGIAVVRLADIRKPEILISLNLAAAEKLRRFLQEKDAGMHETFSQFYRALYKCLLDIKAVEDYDEDVFPNHPLWEEPPFLTGRDVL